MSTAVRYFDPVLDLDRDLLPSRTSLANHNRYRRLYTDAGAMLCQIVCMCQLAGIDVTVCDFAKHRVRRRIYSRPPRYGLARVTAGQIRRMYDDLRARCVPSLFLEILAAHGYVARPRTIIGRGAPAPPVQLKLL